MVYYTILNHTTVQLLGREKKCQLRAKSPCTRHLYNHIHCQRTEKGSIDKEMFGSVDPGDPFHTFHTTKATRADYLVCHKSLMGADDPHDDRTSRYIEHRTPSAPAREYIEHRRL